MGNVFPGLFVFLLLLVIISTPIHNHRRKSTYLRVYDMPHYLLDNQKSQRKKTLFAAANSALVHCGLRIIQFRTAQTNVRSLVQAFQFNDFAQHNNYFFTDLEKTPISVKNPFFYIFVKTINSLIWKTKKHYFDFYVFQYFVLVVDFFFLIRTYKQI